MNERWNELLLAWEDDELTGAEVDELAGLLESDERARAAMVRHFTLSCAIGEQLRETLHEESVVRELRRMTTVTRGVSEGSTLTRSRAGLLTVTAVVLLIAAFVGYHFNLHTLIFDRFGGQTVVEIEALRPRVTQTFGDVRLVDAGQPHDIATGTTLDLGQSLRTSKNSYATLRYPDGTTIQLRGETRMRIEPTRSGKQLTIGQGGLFAEVTPQPRGAPLIVNPHGYDRVEVVGTQFEFVRESTGTSVVRVAKGKVQFGVTTSAVEVAKHEESTASSNRQPNAPQPIEPESIWRGWGHGLRGDYFNWQGSSGAHFTRIDPRIDFHWGKSVPDPRLDGSFAVRWTGEIEAPASGEFTFYTVAHYGVRLWVNGESLINSWASMGAEEDGRPIRLEKGKRYPIKIEYFDRHGDAKMRLLWSGPSRPKSIVGQQWLYPALPIENENGKP